MNRVVGGDIPARIWKDMMTGGLKAGLIARDSPPVARVTSRAAVEEEEADEPTPRPKRVPKWLRRLFGL
jgi:penicillin-binding protein 1A